MMRMGGRFARVQVSSRLTWSFSARAALGRTRRPAHPAGTGLRSSALLLGSLLRAARARRTALPPTRRRGRRG
ncbi:hypothetical protein KUM39_22840 [Streptomyces sp. J2-1]|uniref:hypothetical protein n=1 Tax=Streptomyces corallincola TaxID=2851888 RepID=UPI001C381794|nr:hypothetical protein [Streptomyces corallincola]MBV2357176.1 hypothetical protein [Streptomyces corallincola]